MSIEEHSHHVKPDGSWFGFGATVPLADAAQRLVQLVRHGRRAGDGEVDAAVADVEAALAAQS